METLYNSILLTLANYLMIPDVSSPKFALYLQSLSSDFIKLRQASNEQLTISNPDHNLQATWKVKGVVNIHTFDRAYSDWVMSRYLTQNYLGLPE
ncbi:hypothetical protein [Dactylococcopsis salina]|uniref:Uncharacterized protein n=1 Tax=Dactylococcopsis salina (strain PCC 8305) TaxID=13035 RepID=K9YWL6_DACS8|nr:hypothetical protein [Dactylococcopsis salina]AFZ50907.1 hypothetical protein Dacsa_2293 [Dactylococcopsis salina PCC 8305]